MNKKTVVYPTEYINHGGDTGCVRVPRDGYYHHSFTCSNCSCGIDIDIKRGVKVKGIRIVCTACGVLNF